MKRLRPILWLLLPSLLLLCGTAARASTVSFPLTALEPGQRGYGLTAGAGNRIERFTVEVLALQYDAGSGFPLVLVRTSGPLIEAAGGIASGMSGSPVYLRHEGQDALLGAIGYTFPESRGGYGLITPLATMHRADPREDLEQDVEENAAAPFGPSFNTQRAVPVRTPLLITGLSEKASDLLTPLLADGLQPTPLQTWGNTRPDDPTYRLTPGSAVSVQLVRGDITVAAIGTLTFAEDGAFWAFGHPLLEGGNVSFALAPAYVTAIVPSQNVPFKLADSGQRPLGTVTQDRPYALSGLLERPADFLPVTLTLSGDAGTATKRFEVTRDERFIAPLMCAATLQSLDELLAETGAGSADLAWEIALENGQIINILEQVSDPYDLSFAAAQVAGDPLAQLAENTFQEAHVAEIRMSLTYRERERVAELVEVVPAAKRLKPGEPLELNLRLQPYRQAPEVKSLQVRLPPAFRGTLRLTVRGGLTPPDEHSARRAPPLYSFAELVTALEEHIQGSELVVETVIAGETRLLERLSLPYLVRGREAFRVTVARNPAGDRPSQPDPRPTPEVRP